MTLRQDDPEGYNRRRAYHRNRAVVRKQTERGSRLQPPRMTNQELWRSLIYDARSITEKAESGVDPALLVAAQNVLEVALELRMRGEQLELPV